LGPGAAAPPAPPLPTTFPAFRAVSRVIEQRPSKTAPSSMMSDGVSTSAKTFPLGERWTRREARTVPRTVPEMMIWPTRRSPSTSPPSPTMRSPSETTEPLNVPSTRKEVWKRSSPCTWLPLSRNPLRSLCLPSDLKIIECLPAPSGGRRGASAPPRNGNGSATAPPCPAGGSRLSSAGGG